MNTPRHYAYTTLPLPFHYYATLLPLLRLRCRHWFIRCHTPMPYVAMLRAIITYTLLRLHIRHCRQIALIRYIAAAATLLRGCHRDCRAAFATLSRPPR